MRQLGGPSPKAASTGFVAWLFHRFGGNPQPQPRLALLERITLAPRQTLSLVEAEGRRFLIVNAADGSPAFYALDMPGMTGSPAPSKGRSSAQKLPRRLSW